MSDHKKTAQRFYDEVASGGDLDLIDEILDDAFVEHEELPGMPPTRDGVRATFQMLRAAFPDLAMSVRDMVQEGDKLAVRARMSGTHEGEFMGMPGSGKTCDIEVFDLLEFSGDRLVAHWGVMDQAAMMEQLGGTPE